MSIAKNMRLARKNMGLTQEELAHKINVKKQTIQKYESGVISNVPSDKVEAIADVLNVSPIWLMGWEDEQPAPISESELDVKLIDMLVSLQPDELAMVDAFVQGLIAARKA